ELSTQWCAGSWYARRSRKRAVSDEKFPYSAGSSSNWQFRSRSGETRVSTFSDHHSKGDPGTKQTNRRVDNSSLRIGAATAKAGGCQAKRNTWDCLCQM